MSIRNFTDRHGNRCSVFTWNNKRLSSVVAGAKEVEELKSFLPDGTTCIEEQDFEYFISHPEIQVAANTTKELFPKRLFVIPEKNNPIIVKIGENILKDQNNSLSNIPENELEQLFEPVERIDGDVIV